VRTDTARVVHTPLRTPDVVRYLNRNLGTTLVAYMADVRSRQMPKKWEAGECVPRGAALRRSLLAYEVLKILVDNEDKCVARNWMIGMNPRLDDQAPATFIRMFLPKAALGAARAFVEDVGGA